jgi:hypothetical protein
LALNPLTPVGEILCGAIETEPADRRLRLYQAEDDARRAGMIVDRLRSFLAGGVTQVVSEQPSGSRSARSAGALKLVQGAIVGVFEGVVPIRWLTPTEGKQALCVRRNPSKENMVAAALSLGLKFAGTKPQMEAQADAFAILVASKLWKGARGKAS